MVSAKSSGAMAKTSMDRSKINPIFMALIAVGIFIKFALSEVTLSTDGSTGPATSLIWGYGIVVFSLIGIIIVNVEPGSDELTDLANLPWLIILTIALLVWIISINIQYYKQINEKNVPQEYILWSKYSTFLILCVIFVSVYQYNLYLSETKDHSVSESLLVYSGIAFIFNVIAVSIQQVILSCFYVDG